MTRKPIKSKLLSVLAVGVIVYFIFAFVHMDMAFVMISRDARFAFMIGWLMACISKHYIDKETEYND